MDLIAKNIDSLNKACQKYNVSELYIFGSVLTNGFSRKSDIDFLVTFGTVEPSDYFDNFVDFKDTLENIYKRKIDLVESQAIKNPILKRSIDRNKKLVYGRENSQVLV